MLIQVNINNFALIEKLSLDMKKGFSILSGETGSGKSILIDSVNYVLGGKFNRDLIRTGESKTFVEAIFTLENKKTEEVLKKLGIPYEDLVIISRESFQNGKTIVKVNGKSLMISSLKILSQTLIDIHGQHENQNLLEGNNHITYLDDFGSEVLKDVKEEYTNYFNKYIEIKNRIEEITGTNDREKLISYLKYQIDDISEAKLNAEEEKELEDRFNILTHAEKISFALNNSYRLLYDTRDESKAVNDSLNSIIKDLRNIENHIEKAKKLADNIENAYFILEDAISEIRTLKDTIIYDDEELEKINRRIYAISDYKKKYNKNSIKELIEYKDELTTQYNELINSEEIIKNLEKEKINLEKTLNHIGANLHQKREVLSKNLEKKIYDELKYIGLEKSTFNIEVTKEENVFKQNGISKVQFLISTNPGEPLKPLEKIVSGGELSRIMLALKTVFIDKDAIPTVIFDEIDTGISGRIAQSVAEKMYSISTKHQVFCVTHLPQIASISDNHYLISKEVKENKTYTNVKLLSHNDKEIEIARMIGGAEVTKVTLQNSKEIIKMAEEKQKRLKNIHN